MKPLVIRADANTRIGAGHVMRCLALAQAWQEIGGEVHFMSAFDSPRIKDRLASEDINVLPLSAQPASQQDAADTANYGKRVGADWVVVDGYDFDAAYCTALKAEGIRLLVLDDCGTVDTTATDIILNQNIHADAQLYQQADGSPQLLLGVRYALLRSEFWPWRDRSRPPRSTARRVLVTLGGSDPDNVTLQVIGALSIEKDPQEDELDITVVVGGDNPHLATLQALVAEHEAIRLVHNATNMPELMAWADVAVSAAGSTCWELLFMGLPSCLLALADNQAPIASTLHQHGCAMMLGGVSGASVSDTRRSVDAKTIRHGVRQLLSDAEQRMAMSRTGRQLVDGYGAARVAQVLCEGN